MIHHLARALFVRSSAATRPLTSRIEPSLAAERPAPRSGLAVPPRRLRISSDPCDARRTVIAGRFSEVCAALDRLVMEQEAPA